MSPADHTISDNENMKIVSSTRLRLYWQGLYPSEQAFGLHF